MKSILHHQCSSLIYYPSMLTLIFEIESLKVIHAHSFIHLKTLSHKRTKCILVVSFNNRIRFTFFQCIAIPFFAIGKGKKARRHFQSWKPYLRENCGIFKSVSNLLPAIYKRTLHWNSTNMCSEYTRTTQTHAYNVAFSPNETEIEK